MFQVEHPAAKLMILASEMQEKEIGDGTNFVIIFAGALLEAAEDLLRMVSSLHIVLYAKCNDWVALSVCSCRFTKYFNKNQYFTNSTK